MPKSLGVSHAMFLIENTIIFYEVHKSLFIRLDPETSIFLVALLQSNPKISYSVRKLI